MAITPAGGAPNPYGRSLEIGQLNAMFDQNNANRAATFGDYRGKQMDAIGEVLGQTRQLGELFGGMQTGQLLEMYLNSGALGQGLPTNASLTGGFTSQRDNLTLADMAAGIAQKNRSGRGRGSGTGKRSNWIFQLEDGSYVSTKDPDDLFKAGQRGVRADPPPGTTVRDLEYGGTYVYGGDGGGADVNNGILNNGDGTFTLQGGVIVDSEGNIINE